MSFTYDLTTDAGKVRMLIGDTREESPNFPMFDDAEIAAFLTMEGESFKAAAALALETIAGQEALVHKKIKLLGGDIETDGPAVAESLRKTAAAWRAQEDSAPAFAIAEQAETVFQQRERVFKQHLRGY
jgi:hypothetical protein